ncbi:MAG: tetratricopeptide repeat protein [Gammaproteobacteria bacterium]|nr:tetratricopeptide repeat protein [Gammaproteobacteria bacterium]
MIDKAIEFFENGKIRHNRGDLPGAKGLYLKAIELNPNYGQAYNNLGNVFSDLGNLSEAEDVYRKALELIPDHPMILNNLGNCLHACGLNEEAESLLNKAIKISPNDPVAYSNLGNVFRELGKVNEAVNAFKKAIELNPNIEQVHVNFGNTLKALKDFNGAIQAFEKAIDINPGYSEAYASLSDIYEKLNDIKQLENIYETAKRQLGENDPLLLFVQATVFTRKNKYADALESLEAINPEQFSLAFQKIYSNILAKTHDKLGNYKKAFDQFQLFNDLVKKTNKDINYNSKKYLNNLKQLAKNWSTIDYVNWDNIEDNNTKNRQLVFLVGFPRSGTTLLDTVLRSHNEIFVVEEKLMVQKMLTELNGREDYKSLSDLKSADLEWFREIYYEELHKYIDNSEKAKIIVDKLPLNITHIGLIKRVFPNSKIILSLRHPYDVVLSCFMQSFKLNDSMSNFLSLNTSAELYSAVMDLWEQYVRSFQLDYISIKYEDLVLDLKSSVLPILNYLGIQWDDGLLDYQKTAFNRIHIDTPSYNQVTQDLYKTSINRWVNYREDMEVADEYLLSWVKKFNY